MALKNFDSRQTEHRSLLDQLALVVDKSLKDLLPSINSELIMPLRIVPNDPTVDRQVNIEAGVITNPETGRKRAFAPIQQVFPGFTSGSVTFPATSGNNISVSPGDDEALTVPSNEYVKVLIQIFSDGNLGVAVGTPNAVEANAEVPPHASNALPIGFVTLFNNAGTIDNVDNGDITQFVGGGGSGGSGNGGGFDVFYAEDFTLTGPGDFETGNNATVGAGGSINGTLAFDSVTPIRGDNSLLYTQGASSLNDYFLSPVIELDRKQDENTVGFNLYVENTGDDGDFRFVVYDEVNGEELNIDGSDLLIDTTSVSTRVTGSVFIPSGVNQIRWGVQVEVANNGATLKIDDVQFSINPFVYKNITNIEDFGKVSITLNGFGTVASQDIWVTRIGSYLQMGGRFDPGTTAATQAQIVLPFGLQADTARIGADQTVGTFFRHVSTTANGGSLILDSSAPTIILFGNPNTFNNVNLNAVASVNGNLVSGGGNPVSFQTSLIPIEGWQDETEHVITPAKVNLLPWTDYTPGVSGFGTISGLTASYKQIGDSLFGRVTFTAGTLSGTAANTYVELPSSLNIDTGKEDNRICGNGANNGSDNHYPIVIDTSLSTGRVYFGGTSNPTDPAGSTTFGSSNQEYTLEFGPIAIEEWKDEVQFLAALPAPPSFYATSNSGQSVASGATIVYEDVIFDSHNAYNNSTGIYTVPEDGVYEIDFGARTANTTAPANADFFAIRADQSGSVSRFQISQQDFAIANSVARNYNTNGSVKFKARKNDEIKITTFYNINSVSLQTTADGNYFAISKVGL